MVKVNSYNLEKKQDGSLDITAKVLGQKASIEMFHFVVKDYLHQKRSMNSKAKGRSDVRGGGAKPWNQKGTGRARAGTNTSPLWVGGGVTFGPQGLKRATKINKKVKRQALLGALTSKLDNLLVFEGTDKFSSVIAKTNDFAKIVSEKKLDDKRILYVSKDKASREAVIGNYNNLGVTSVYGLNVYDILNASSIIIEDSAIAQLEEIYTK